MTLTDNPVALRYLGGTVMGRSGNWGARRVLRQAGRLKNVDDAVRFWRDNYFRPKSRSEAKVRSAFSKYGSVTSQA